MRSNNFHRDGRDHRNVLNGVFKRMKRWGTRRNSRKKEEKIKKEGHLCFSEQKSSVSFFFLLSPLLLALFFAILSNSFNDGVSEFSFWCHLVFWGKITKFKGNFFKDTGFCFFVSCHSFVVKGTIQLHTAEITQSWC